MAVPSLTQPPNSPVPPPADLARFRLGQLPETSNTRWAETLIPSGPETLYVRIATPHAPPPASPPAPVYPARVAILHGYGDHIGRYTHLMTALAHAGIPSAGVDLRGQGRSTGARSAVCPWDAYLEDVERLLLSPAFPPARATFIFGHSHGGLIAAVAAVRGLWADRLDGVVLSAPYLATAFPIPGWKRALAAVVARVMPTLKVSSGLGPIPMCRDPEMEKENLTDELICGTATPSWFVGSTAAQREALTNAPAARLPVLMLIGTHDGVASPDAMRSLFARLGSPDKTKIEYPGLYHELMRELEREQVFADVIGWVVSRTGPSPTGNPPV